MCLCTYLNSLQGGSFLCPCREQRSLVEKHIGFKAAIRDIRSKAIALFSAFTCLTIFMFTKQLVYNAVCPWKTALYLLKTSGVLLRASSDSHHLCQCISCCYFCWLCTFVINVIDAIAFLLVILLTDSFPYIKLAYVALCSSTKMDVNFLILRVWIWWHNLYCGLITIKMLTYITGW